MKRPEPIWYLTPIAESASLERYKEALSMAISALRDQEARRWIPVTERLPDLELVDEKSDDFDLYACLVTVKNCRAKNGRYEKKAWYDGEIFMDENCADITDKVTHWMPLPVPPKEM